MFDFVKWDPSKITHFEKSNVLIIENMVSAIDLINQQLGKSSIGTESNLFQISFVFVKKGQILKCPIVVKYNLF